MSKYRKDARIDTNQPEIVKALRMIPGCTVETGKDDILVGFRGKTFWFEIKTPDCLSKQTGKIRDAEKKDGQKKLEREWRGHYRIVTSLTEILKDIQCEK